MRRSKAVDKKGINEVAVGVTYSQNWIVSLQKIAVTEAAVESIFGKAEQIGSL